MPRRHLATFAAGLAALLLAASCSIHQRAREAARAVETPLGRSACVLLFDGLSARAFRRLVAAGALPNLKREIVDRGLSFETAVTSVPSETYPNVGALLTGLYPGHHGIPANVWLDRRLRLAESHTNIFRILSASDFLAPDARTLYERLPADSVAVTSPIARGASVDAKNVIALTASYARWDWEFLDRKTLDDVGDAYMGAIDAGRLPSLAWAHLLGPDEVAHADGPDSPEFRAALESIDRAFGRLVRRLRRRGAFEKILFVLLGDHGNQAYATAVDAEELVHRALFAHPTDADCAKGNCVLVPARGKRAAEYDVGDAQIAVGAYRGLMIWLPASRLPDEVPQAFGASRRKPSKTAAAKAAAAPARPVPHPPLSEFATALSRTPEVALVVTRGSESGHVLVYGPRGVAEIVREERDDDEPVYGYRVRQGEDPFGYARDPRLAPYLTGGPFTAPEWLEATARTDYPDLVVQLPEFFDSPRAPDVFISPRDTYGFRSGKAAGHGGLSRSEMIVPVVFAGPGVAPGRRPVARTVDLAPTLLRWLGVPFDPEAMDGDDLGIAPPPAGR
ncbi:MAG TPA: alkaline phosphatase family protein [Thermoanaerobaculia bacterium]|nr:alkaline phosphatase family protein [Thermoanaerobaculia bacterium]